MATGRILWGLVLAMLAALPSCVRQKHYDRLKAEYESLVRLNASYQQELEQTDSIISGMFAYFEETQFVGGLISINAQGRESYRREKMRIEESIHEMLARLEERERTVDSMERELKQTSQEGGMLVSMIGKMRRDIERQRASVQELGKQAVARALVLNDLKVQTVRLGRSLQDARDQEASQREQMERLEREMNVVRYCIGTRNDLRELNILKNKEIFIEEANLDYFSSADMRELTELDLMAKKARILSIHPTKSYVLETTETGAKKLVIRDPVAFWSYSRTLIIEVD